MSHRADALCCAVAGHKAHPPSQNTLAIATFSVLTHLRLNVLRGLASELDSNWLWVLANGARVVVGLGTASVDLCKTYGCSIT